MKKLNFFKILFFIFLFVTIFEIFSVKEVYAFVENFQKKYDTDDSKYEAVIEFSSNYIPNRSLTTLELRKKNNENFSKIHQKYKTVVDFKGLDVYYSKYAPYAFITFSNYDDYDNNKSKLNKICRDNYIESITVEKFLQEKKQL